MAPTVTFSKETRFIWVSVHGVPYQHHMELRQLLKKIPTFQGEEMASSTISLCYSLDEMPESTLLRAVRHALSECKQKGEQFWYRNEWVFWAMIGNAARPDSKIQQLTTLALREKDFISEADWVAPKGHANAVRLVLTMEPNKSHRQQIVSVLTKHLKL